MYKNDSTMMYQHHSGTTERLSVETIAIDGNRHISPLKIQLDFFFHGATASSGPEPSHR
jgi:hypothetical protein